MSDGVFWPEFKAWLEAHGIDVNECAEVAVSWTPRSVHQPSGVCMEVTYYLLDRQGRRFMVAGEPATKTITLPMQHLPAVDVVRYRQESA